MSQVLDRLPCAHCGLLVSSSSLDAFCCSGCRTAYGMIQACGLESFYALRDREDGERVAARTTDGKYGEYDDSTFQELHSRPAGPHRRIDLFLEGIHCNACVWLIEKLPRVCPGVISARLLLHRSLVHLVWDPASVQLSTVARSLDRLGYPPHPPRSTSEEDRRVASDRRDLGRIALAGALAGNIMIMAVALYAGLIDRMSAFDETMFRWGNMVLGMISLLGPGSVFLRGGWAALVMRSQHLDVPIALALVAGGLGGLHNTITGTGEIYIDSLSVLVFLLLVGRFLKHRQQRSSEDALELLFALTPRVARRVREETIEEVPVEALVPSDVLEVRAGDSVPVDGLVTEGSSALDQSFLTGEAFPVPVSPGDRVAAGTTNRESTFRMEVKVTGRETRLGQLMDLVEECSRRRAPIVQFTDRISVRFVTVVSALSLVTYLGWSWMGSPGALDHAVALLVVSCPCALGLATPLALAVAIGRAARRKILVKGGDTFEGLTRSGLILLDKTGTVTRGEVELRAWLGDERWKSEVLAIEQHSAHPIARAAVTGLTARGVLPSGDPMVVKQTTAGGVEAASGTDRFTLGSLGFVRERGASLDVQGERWVESCTARGWTPVCFARNGRVESVLGFGDSLREGIGEALGRLSARGWRIGLLSGDHRHVVERVARELGIQPELTHAEMIPEEKLALVRHYQEVGPVVMVGDGVNDAAALAEASVGVAVHGGAEASLAAADVYLARPGLGSLVELVDASRSTLAVIRRCLGVSLAYNAIGVTLSMAGVIHPLIAALLMPFSSLSILALCLGSRTFQED